MQYLLVLRPYPPPDVIDNLLVFRKIQNGLSLLQSIMPGLGCGAYGSGLDASLQHLDTLAMRWSAVDLNSPSHSPNKESTAFLFMNATL